MPDGQAAVVHTGAGEHDQIRESGSSFFYILQGHDNVNPVYRFVEVDPTDGSNVVIFPAP